MQAGLREDIKLLTDIMKPVTIITEGKSIMPVLRKQIREDRFLVMTIVRNIPEEHTAAAP